MRLPFTAKQFFRIFRQYNETVWPAQWLLVLAALAAVVLALRGGPRAGRIVSAILAMLWLWMGVVYHLLFFRTINPAALAFGVLCIGQSVLFAWLGVQRGQVRFRPRWDAAGVVGGALLLYALVIYPALGYALGHRYPDAPTFGLPCPTTIFTFGLLLWTRPVAPRSLLVFPVLWAIIGTSAAVQLGVREDFGLPVAAALAIALLLRRRERTGVPQAA
jgi:hypothetical protein